MRLKNLLSLGFGPPDPARRHGHSIGVLATASAALIIWSASSDKHRKWAASEVPVAFWSWRSVAPSEAEVLLAVRQTNAATIFIRAGQIDRESATVRRIRAVTGPLPRRIDIHLVYNATSSLLSEFERIDSNELSSALISALDQDTKRAAQDGASIVGLQLDFDVPTRLLREYAELLRKVRSRLAAALKLSITGLPTWMDSADLAGALAICDFWIPQLYGAQIPERLEQMIPISSSMLIARDTARARKLGRLFYAGLAAYGYVIHYSRSGSLVDLRGDVDPAALIQNPSLKLIDQSKLAGDGSTTQPAEEWRSVFRAEQDTTIDGISLAAGETLLLSWPTAEGLRISARRVREQAGDRLMGICVFRVPTEGDRATLTIGEISTALKDRRAPFSFDARIDNVSSDENRTTALLTLRNSGATASRIGERALTVIVRVPAGGLRGATSDDRLLVEPVHEAGGSIVPCMFRRANAIRFTARWWPPGEKATAQIEFARTTASEVDLDFTAAIDAGDVMRGRRTLALAGGR
jgi:hypothetical protein